MVPLAAVVCQSSFLWWFFRRSKPVKFVEMSYWLVFCHNDIVVSTVCYIVNKYIVNIFSFNSHHSGVGVRNMGEELHSFWSNYE